MHLIRGPSGKGLILYKFGAAAARMGSRVLLDFSAVEHGPGYAVFLMSRLFSSGATLHKPYRFLRKLIGILSEV